MLITSSTLRAIQDLSFYYVNLDCGNPRLDFSEGIPLLVNKPSWSAALPFLNWGAGNSVYKLIGINMGFLKLEPPLSGSSQAYPHTNKTKRMNGIKDMHRKKNKERGKLFVC